MKHRRCLPKWKFADHFAFVLRRQRSGSYFIFHQKRMPFEWLTLFISLNPRFSFCLENHFFIIRIGWLQKPHYIKSYLFFNNVLELRRYKNDSMESTSTFVLKLPRFFTRLYALWEKLPYFRSCLKRPIFRKKCHSLQNVHQFCKKSKNQLFFWKIRTKSALFSTVIRWGEKAWQFQN